MKRLLSEFLVDHPRIVLCLALAVTVLAAVPLRDLAFFQEDIGELDPDDPEVAFFQDFQQEFGEEEFITLAVEAPDVFTAPVLRYIQALSREAERLPTVDHTSSLINAEDLQVSGGTLSATPFVEQIPQDQDGLAQLRARALDHKYWAGSLVSRDGTVAAVQVALRRDGKAVPRIEAADQLNEILARLPKPDGTRVLAAGRGPIIADSMRYMRSDLRRFLWLTPVLIVALLFYLFRSARGVIVPLTVSALAVLWTFGLFLATGNQVSLPITMLPTLIAVICLSDTIHIMSHYLETIARHGERRAALLETMDHMIGACLLTSLSTAVGIGSLILSGMLSLQQFAIWASIGILIAYLLSVGLVPAILALLPPPSQRVQGLVESSLIARAMQATVRLVFGHRALGLALTAIGIALTCGIGLIQVDTRFSSNIPASAPSGQASELLKSKLSGTSMVQIVIDGAPYTFEEPEHLRAVKQVEDLLLAQPEINHVTSVVDLIEETHRQFDPTAGGSQAIPDDGRELTDYFVYLSQTDLLDRLANADRSRVVLYAAMNELGTAAQLDLLHRVDDFARRELPATLTLHSTGTAKLFATTSHKLVNGQVRSLAFTSLALALMLIIALRSIRLGLLSMIPNAIPVVLTLGAMGYLGIPLGTSTIMISCIAIGIAVDDTIHFLSRYLRESATSSDPIAATILSTGRAIVFTTLVFTGGFIVFAFSNFEPTRHFGLLTAFAMIAALFADMLVLPLLLRWRRTPPVRP